MAGIIGEGCADGFEDNGSKEIEKEVSQGVALPGTTVNNTWVRIIVYKEPVVNKNVGDDTLEMFRDSSGREG